MRKINDTLNEVMDKIALAVFGRAPKLGECLSCGKLVNIDTDFRDELSRKKYLISFFCQDCQDEVFSK